MTLRDASGYEREGLNAVLAEKNARARIRLVELAKHPTCVRCKQPHPSGPGGWMTARDLVDGVFAAPEWRAGDGASINLALMQLEAEGVFERGPDLKVRLKR